jgi:hypothetical protein
MLLALALLAACPFCWTWDRVLTSCTGGSEAVSHYYFQATVRQIECGLPYDCLDDQGQIVTCLECWTATAPPIRFGPDIPDPGEGASVSASFDPVEDPTWLPDPPVGALHAWPWSSPESDPVVAVDTAGNESGGCP